MTAPSFSPEPESSASVTDLRASLRLIEVGRRKGWIEGYARALLDSGPVPPTPELHDAWMERYRQRAIAVYGRAS